MKLSKELKSMIDKYTIVTEWDEDDQIYIASVGEIPECKSHGKTREHATEMVREALEGFLESLLKHKEEIPQPFSLQSFPGEFLVRATPELQKRIVYESKKSGYKSTNKFVVDLLTQHVSKKQPTRTTKKLA